MNSDFKTFIHTCRRQWKRFVCSICCCVAAAIIYLLMAVPQYERSASLLIKDESGTGGILSSMSANMGMLAGLAGLNIASNVNNEMAILSSPALMQEVVNRLELDTRYEVYDGLMKTELYDESLPIKVTFPKLSAKDGAYMKMSLRRDGSYMLYKFRKNKDKLEGEVEGNINAVTHTPIGPVSVIGTKNFERCMADKDEMTIRITKEKKYDCTERYMRRLDIDLADDQTSVISITCRDMSGDRAERIINALITIYQEEWMKDKQTTAEASTRFINERIKDIEAELSGLDNDIAQFKGRNLMPDYSEAARMYMENAALTYEAQVKVNNQLYMMEQMRNQIRKEDGTNQVLPANLLPDNENVAIQISEYNKLQLQRNSMAENSSDNNPLVKDLDTQLSSMRKAILNSLEQAVAQLRASQKGISNEDKKLKRDISTAPEKVIKVLPAERQHKIIEALYIYLLEKREENSLTQVFHAQNLRIISPPMGKLKPIAPKKGTILLLALVIGALLPTFSIYLRQNVKRILSEE